jgi:hypothetical protein
MFHFYSMNRDMFEKHYHQRSNVQSAFSMIKAKFRDSVRSKAPVAMKNEVLCKIIAHNNCCLIMTQLELGIEPVFWNDASAPVEGTGTQAVPVELSAAAVKMEAAPVVAAAVLQETHYQICVGG